MVAMREKPPENPPTENAVYDGSISGKRNDKNDIAALSIDDTATPASTRVTLRREARRAIALIVSVAASAPRNAPSGRKA